MRRDERVPSVAVDVGIESNLARCGRDLGDSARAHVLKRIGKNPLRYNSLYGAERRW